MVYKNYLVGNSNLSIVQASFSVTKATLEVSALKTSDICSYMVNTVAHGINVLMCLIRSCFWAFSVLPVLLRLNLCEKVVQI